MDNSDRELLQCLVEECSEVIHAASKALRHGLQSRNPFMTKPITNQDDLNREMGDIECICVLLCQREILNGKDMGDAYDNKMKNLGQYLHHNIIKPGGICKPRDVEATPADKIDSNDDVVLVGSVWRHYANKESYRVEDTPVNPNTEEMFVVYRRIGSAVGEGRFVRPVTEFWGKFAKVDSGRDTSAPRSFA